MIYVIGGVAFAISLFMIWPMPFPGPKIKGHKGVPKGVFISQLSVEGVPEHISSVVYDFYKRKGHSNQFSPSPEMDINGIFEEGPEDIDDAAMTLLRELHLDPPSEADRIAWASDREICTVGDLAQWLYWASQHQQVKQ